MTGLSGCIFTSQDIPASLVGAGGTPQEVAVNAQAAKPLTVRVLNQDLDPMEDVTITWEIKSGTGTLSALTTTTDGDGETSITYTAGATTGVTRVLAIQPTLAASVSFTITVK